MLLVASICVVPFASSSLVVVHRLRSSCHFSCLKLLGFLGSLTIADVFRTEIIQKFLVIVIRRQSFELLVDLALVSGTLVVDLT